MNTESIRRMAANATPNEEFGVDAIDMLLAEIDKLRGPWRVLFDALVSRDAITSDALAMLAGNLGITLMSGEEVWTNLWQSAVVRGRLSDEWLSDELRTRGYFVGRVVAPTVATDSTGVAR